MQSAMCESLYLVVGPYIVTVLALYRALYFDVTWLAGLQPQNSGGLSIVGHSIKEPRGRRVISL